MLPAPTLHQLPPIPPQNSIPKQVDPFVVPDDYETLKSCLLHPIAQLLEWIPNEKYQTPAKTIPGGEEAAWKCLNDLLQENEVDSDTKKAETICTNFPKLLAYIGAYISQGCISAPQIHHYLAKYENCNRTQHSEIPDPDLAMSIDRSNDILDIRLQLLRRDYASVCARAMQDKIFLCNGQLEKDRKGSRGHAGSRGCPPTSCMMPFLTGSHNIRIALNRFAHAKTRQSIVDTSTKNVLKTGFASPSDQHHTLRYLFRDARIDWRYGAEWYEMWLVDYDVSLNWVSWKHFATSPLHRPLDTDFDGQFLREWLPRRKLDDAYAAIFVIQKAATEFHKSATLLRDECRSKNDSRRRAAYYEIDLDTNEDNVVPTKQVKIRHNDTKESVASVRLKNCFNSVVSQVRINDREAGKRRDLSFDRGLETFPFQEADLVALPLKKPATITSRLQIQEDGVQRVLGRLASHYLARVYSVAHCESLLLGDDKDAVMREIECSRLCVKDKHSLA